MDMESIFTQMEVIIKGIMRKDSNREKAHSNARIINILVNGRMMNFMEEDTISRPSTI